MECALSLTRPAAVSYEQCIICQEDKKDALFNASQDGLQRMKSVSEVRKNLRDSRYRAVIERVFSCFEDKKTNLFKWHRGCHGTYTSETHINRLRHKLVSKTESTSASSHTEHDCKRLRSHSKPMNWNLCLFCQVDVSK